MYRQSMNRRWMVGLLKGISFARASVSPILGYFQDISGASSDVQISGSDRLSALPGSSPHIRGGQGFTTVPSPLLNQNLPLSYSLPAFDIRPLYSRSAPLAPDTTRDTFRRLSFESERAPISRVIYQGRPCIYTSLFFCLTPLSNML
jgi:hypothetical protein